MNYSCGAPLPPGLVQVKQSDVYRLSKPKSSAPSEDRTPHRLEHESRSPHSQMPVRVGKVEKPLPVGQVLPGLLLDHKNEVSIACVDHKPDEQTPTHWRKRTDNSAATMSTACPADEEEAIWDLAEISEEGGGLSAREFTASEPQRNGGECGNNDRTADCSFKQGRHDERAENEPVPGPGQEGRSWPTHDEASDPLVDRLWVMKEKHEVPAWRSIYQCREQHAASLDWLKTVQENLLYLSMISKRGSLIVQDAISIVDVAQQKAMARQLHGHVLETTRSPHANHVLQKCITEMPLSNIQFIVDAMLGNVTAIAHHNYGCRVVIRLFEHCSFEQTDNLAKELLSDTKALVKLCKKHYGNYVVQSALEHLSATSEQRRQLLDLLCLNMCELSANHFGKFVVLKLVNLGGPLDKRNLEAFRTSRTFNHDKLLSNSHHGSFVKKSIRRKKKQQAT